MEHKCKHESLIMDMKKDMYGNGHTGMKIKIHEHGILMKEMKSTLDSLNTSISAFHKFQNEQTGKDKMKKQNIIVLTVSISTVVALLGIIVTLIIN